MVVGGRTFMRNILNLMTNLKEQHHYTRISAAAKADIAWWQRGLKLFHGIAPFTCDIPVPNFHFSTDACLLGGGAIFLKDWCYMNWEIDYPELVGVHINELELKTVLVAAERWGPLWKGKHVRVFSDNTATVSALNKGTSRGKGLLEICQRLFWCSVEHGFRLTAVHLPGKLNVASDKISRLHELSIAIEAKSLLFNDCVVVECVKHMSHETFLHLQECWMKDC